ILFELIYNQSFLTDTFIILHAAFVTALYKVVGMDFGAEFLQRFVERFDADYEKEAHPTTQENGEKSADDSNASTVTRKEMVNAMSLLSHLYNFHMIGCGLVFDYIRLFLSEITELNTELLLKVIR
ncbi:suppressor of glycerol defect, partial [Ascosphaera atra]